MINNVTKKEVIDAMEYFFVEGFIDELTSDKKHYTKILLNKVANDYKIKLDWGDEQMDWWMVLVIPLAVIGLLMWCFVLVYRLDRKLHKRKGEKE